MNFKVPAVRTLLTAFLIIIAFTVKAQPPVLPDMAGITQKGIVILTWTSKYDALKSIAVERSSDSVHNFVTIGYVRNTAKGVQAYIDGHPNPGKNFYQLRIVFSSDLEWQSNHITLKIDSSVLKRSNLVLPPNDSLQRLLFADKHNSRSRSGIVVTIDTGDINQDEPMDAAATLNKVVTSLGGGYANNSNNPTDTVEGGRRRHNIAISIVEDTTVVDPYTFVRSQYVYTNPLSGHVDMQLPGENLVAHRFSIRFFNAKNEEVLDIPRITQPAVIIDKRNFRQKGIYKFTLKKDNKEMERGYITIY